MSRLNLDLQASHKMLMLLDEANAHAEAIIDAVPGLFLITNEQGQVLRANREFADLFAMDDDGVFRLPLSRLFRDSAWKVFAHNISRVIEAASAGSLHFEMPLLVGGCAAEAAERPYYWTVTRQSARPQGEGRLLTVFGTDISEMRNAERRLSEVFASIPLGIFTVDREGRIGSSYSSYLESMLRSKGRLAGMKVEDELFRGAARGTDAALGEGIRAILSSLGAGQMEFEALARLFPGMVVHDPEGCGDKRWLRVSYQPIVFGGVVEQLLVILEDRTAIVKAEEEMLEAAKDREKARVIERQSLAMYESAIRDPLTGLFTRLYMRDAVSALLWSHDHGEVDAVSLAMFDIDHFKRVNDTYGHAGGDVVLAEVARIILRHCDAGAIPVRFGGEEFAVFLPDALTETSEFAERVRREVDAATFDVGQVRIRATISAGAASHAKGEAIEEFMGRTDELLYAAKNGGRNQVVADRRKAAGAGQDDRHSNLAEEIL